MPLLGGLLVNLFSGVVAWLSAYVTRKVAFGLAAVAMYGTITAALFIAMRAALNGLAAAMPGLPTMFIEGLRLGVPPVAPLCLSTYVTIWTVTTVYTWQRDLLYLAMKA